MNDFERGMKRIGMSQETQMYEMEKALQKNKEKQTLASHSSVHQQSDRDIEQLKQAIIEVLDTGFESSERDMVLVLDRIDVWEKGELRRGEHP